MKNKKVPFTLEQIKKIVKEYPTPFHIYDEKPIIENIQKLYDSFSWMPGFKNYFAVKACPNPFIMKLLKSHGVGSDCSSLPELELSDKVGITGENIMFTSNDTPANEFKRAYELGAIINLDDISHIDFLEKALDNKFPKLICFRYNPGKEKEGNDIIGNPEDAKYGLTKKQLFEAYEIAKNKGVERFGLHTMVVSNELDPKYFIHTATMLFDLAVEIKEQLNINLEFVNLGGGVGIPYKPEDKPVDLEIVSDGIKNAYEKIIKPNGLDGLKIVMECGRMVTGPYGYLVSTVQHIKKTYKNYVGLDACMTNLMRPALYGAYHHITVLGKEDEPNDNEVDVTGSLCENNDKFAINRMLPETKPGDIIVIHDAGAHGYAMGFNYNGKLRSAELLLRTNGEIVKIRNAETMKDLFATLNFNEVHNFTVYEN